MYSTSSSSSPFHSFGVESLSLTGLPLSSWSSDICASFLIIFAQSCLQITLKSTCTYFVSNFSPLKALSILSSPFSLDK